MSDNQDDGFQDLGEQYQQILDAEDSYQPVKNNQKYDQNYQPVPSQSTIRYKKYFRENIYKVKIQQSENKIDMNILQSQFYTLKLYQKQKLIKQNLQRRYSDFDLLFEILEKKFPGFVFPAFPQKGILSYVKTKVTVTKDEKLLKNRIRMIERFLNNILNEEKFSPEKCSEVKKFFSQNSQYQLFKKTAREDLNRSKSIVDSTWGIIKDFFKMSQATKYSTMIEEIKKQKQPFEELLTKTQQFLALITDQLQSNRALSQCQNTSLQRCTQLIPSFLQLKKLLENYSQQLNPILTELNELEFILYCENEDYMMVLKKIELIQQMKESEQNYKNLAAIENEFAQKLNELQVIKKEKIEKLKLSFKDIVERINQIQRGKQ